MDTPTVAQGQDSGIATDDDEREAVAAELSAAGVSSFEELERQARSGEFTSERARRAWFTLAPLDVDWGSC